MSGALDGVRVLDLSRYIPGPYASMLLADLGADVIAVEPPTGDPARRMLPIVGDDSSVHRWLGRNKRSVALDLKTTEGLDRFRNLLVAADVVIEGFSLGVTTRLGIDYAACREVNQSIVYCSITGSGADETTGARPGHDLNYQARAGILDQVTSADGVPATPGVPMADLSAGTHGAVAILAALLHRDSTGEGQAIEVSLLGAALAMAGPQLVKVNVPEPLPREHDHNLGSDPAYRLYRTADDRYVSIGAFEDKYWSRLCSLLVAADLVEQRQSDPTSAIKRLTSIFAGRDLAHWDQLLGPEDVCYAPVNRIGDVQHDPLITARGDFIGHSDAPDLRIPIQMSVTPPTFRAAAPRLDGAPLEWVER